MRTGSKSRPSLSIFIVVLAVVLLLLTAVFYLNGKEDTDADIPLEILECDYCTFNYWTPFTLGYTHQQADGNRVVDGRMDLLNASHTDVALSGEPEWIVTSNTLKGAVWAVVMEDGEVQAFILSDGNITEFDISPERIHTDSPPLLMIKDEEAFIVAPGISNESLLTHPIVLASSGRNIFVDELGELVFRVNEKEIARFELVAIPDARLLLDENERLLLLTGATEKYRHGVLGDRIEASGMTLVNTAVEPSVAKKISIPKGDVIEGIAPIWVDLDNDGTREIIVTLSNEDEGARLVVFGEDGKIIASGPSVGTGSRWRHQIAVAPFGPEGETEIASVLTPHIGGITEFYRLEGNELKVVASVPGYTSHVIGSRNLDMGIAGDLNDDGYAELLLPSQDLKKLGIIKHTETGAKVIGNLELDGRLSTNLAAAKMPDGSIVLAAGNDNGILRIWH
ncbi:hypothetical protein V7O66_09600 [Methanolobus sp. ZRKC3]|uniref:hypothetical protein n=1 Tax=Methanolobus sp. ZRKC3 TaxID=3125786 RepID=UPI0032549BCA